MTLLQALMTVAVLQGLFLRPFFLSCRYSHIICPMALYYSRLGDIHENFDIQSLFCETVLFRLFFLSESSGGGLYFGVGGQLISGGLLTG